MDETTFWRLMVGTRDAAGGARDAVAAADQAECLSEFVSQLPPEEIIAFENILGDKLNAAYRWDLWDAATLINCWCSDDGFLSFRAWLVGQGPTVYEMAVREPDTLADVADGRCRGKDLLNVALKAYEAKTGQGFPAESRRIGGEDGPVVPAGKMEDGKAGADLCRPPETHREVWRTVWVVTR